ncbi:MAG: hypothetical protein NC124_13480 [Clostridium sp.]|nr:hypothetical protein [Clostridium sp.]
MKKIDLDRKISTEDTSEIYLNQIQPYITKADEDVMNCYSTKKYLEEIVPQLSDRDLCLVIQLIHEINKAGCHVLFMYRIDSLETDEIIRITPILINYIDHFERLSTNFSIIINLGRQGNYQATDLLIKEFKKPNIYKKEITDEMTDHQKSVAWNTSRRWAVSNALLQIRDKSRLDDYIEFAYNSDTRKDCLIIADLVGKFKCQKSYDCLIDLLSDEDYKLQSSALGALKGFYKYDGIEEHIRPFLNSEYKVIRENAGKIMKKILTNK